MSDQDDKILQEIRNRIAASVKEGKSTKESWEYNSLQYCLTLIEELKDENSSLWFMLEEIKKSREWTQSHTDELSKTIGEHLMMLRFMKMNKGEA